MRNAHVFHFYETYWLEFAYNIHAESIRHETGRLPLQAQLLREEEEHTQTRSDGRARTWLQSRYRKKPYNTSNGDRDLSFYLNKNRITRVVL